jgi:hypothetical protein
MKKNSKVALLIDTRTNTGKDYMGAEAVTILGNAQRVRRGKGWSALAGVFLKKHPRLADIIRSEKTALVMVKIKACTHVSRFQTVTKWNIQD